jgi:phosphoglycerate dehydrogenase-like enzyme
MTTIVMRLASHHLSDAQRDEIQKLAPDKRLVTTNDHGEIEALLDEVEIAAGYFPQELLSRASNLRWYQQWSAGSDWLRWYPELETADFTLTNASGVSSNPISEHILAFLLAFARGLPKSIRAQERRVWLPDEEKVVFELPGKIMLLIGVGAIGCRTATLATALGLQVWGVRRDPSKQVEGITAMYGPEQLLQVLPQVDVVVLTVPFTEETRGIIGESELRAMKQSAYMINVGRGGTVQEDALIKALTEGWIAGAAFDVFEAEPLPPESPLWAFENFILTPHYAGKTPYYDERIMEIFLDNLRRYESGQPLRNVVNRKLGY